MSTVATMLAETLKGYKGRTSKLDVSVPFAHALAVETYFDPQAARTRILCEREIGIARREAAQLYLPKWPRRVFPDRRVDNQRRFAMASTVVG